MVMVAVSMQHIVIVLLASLYTVKQAATSTEDLDYFFSYGVENGDVDLNITSDISRKIVLQEPFKILNRNFSTLCVNRNGVLSFQCYFSNILQQNLNISLFNMPWSTTHLNSMGSIFFKSITSNNEYDTYVLKLRDFLYTYLSYSFHPTNLQVITWKYIGSNGNSSKANIFQCVMSTNEEESFILFLYSIDDVDSISKESLMGIHTTDKHNQFILPTRSALSASNIDLPGAWVFKVDTHILSDHPIAAHNLTSTDVAETYFFLHWTHPHSNDSTVRFTIHCMPYPSAYIVEHYATSAIINGLAESTTYACHVNTINLFGPGPSSERLITTTKQQTRDEAGEFFVQIRGTTKGVKDTLIQISPGGLLVISVVGGTFFIMAMFIIIVGTARYLCRYREPPGTQGIGPTWNHPY